MARGSHTINVKLVGNDRDLQRALRSSSRSIRSLGKAATTAGIAVAALGAASLSAHASVLLLGGATALLSGSVVALSGAITGGLVVALARLGFTSKEWENLIKGFGDGVRDMATKSLPLFYKAVEKVFNPELVRPFFDELTKGGGDKALAGLVQIIIDNIPKLAEAVGKFANVFATLGGPFLESLLNAAEILIGGLTAFFKGFMRQADPKVLELVATDIAGVLEWLGEKLGAWSKDASAKWDTFKTKMKEFGDALTPVFNVLKQIGQALLNLTPQQAVGLIALGTALVAIGAVAGPLASVASFLVGLPGALTAIGAAVTAISLPIVAVVAVIAVLVGLFVTAYTRSETLRTAVSNTWTSIKNAVVKAWGVIQPALQDLWDAWVELADALTPFFTALVKWIGFAGPKVIALVGIFVKAQLIITGTWVAIVGAAFRFQNALNENMAKAARWIKEKLQGAIDFLKTLPSKAYALGKDIVQKLVDGLKSLNPGNVFSGIIGNIKSITPWSASPTPAAATPMAFASPMRAPTIVNNYKIEVNSLVSDKATGRQVVKAIKEYEYVAGKSWRTA